MCSVFCFIGCSLFLWFVGLIGVLMRRNLIGKLISMELMILAAVVNFMGCSQIYNQLNGQVFALFSLGIAAAESALGLAIFVLYFHQHGAIDADKIHHLKG